VSLPRYVDRSLTSEQLNPNLDAVAQIEEIGELVQDEKPISEDIVRPSGPGEKASAGYGFERTLGWDPATKRMVVIVLLLAIIGIIWYSRAVLPMLAFSAIVAYLLSPIVDTFERLHIPRSVTTVILFSLLFFGLLLIPILLLPLVIQQLVALSNFEVGSTARALLGWFNDYWTNLPEYWTIFGFQLSVGEAARQIEQNVREFDFIPSVDEFLIYIQRLITTTTSVITSTATIGFNFLGGIVQAFITSLIAFFLSLYLTKDAPIIRAYVEGLFPSSYQSELAELLRRVGHIWRGFFRGQLMLAVIVGTVTGLVLWLAGMPGAFLLGVVAGVFEVIPNLGPFLAMIPAVLVALIQGSPFLADYGINNFEFAVITIATYFVIQQLENNLLVPRIIGNNVNLHPIVVLCSVAVGLNTAGILGALLASPVVATVRVVGSYLYAKLLDYPPFWDVHLPLSRGEIRVQQHKERRLAENNE